MPPPRKPNDTHKQHDRSVAFGALIMALALTLNTIWVLGLRNGLIVFNSGPGATPFVERLAQLIAPGLILPMIYLVALHLTLKRSPARLRTPTITFFHTGFWALVLIITAAIAPDSRAGPPYWSDPIPVLLSVPAMTFVLFLISLAATLWFSAGHPT
ncbi:MAG: hypothetical protein ACRC6I_19985 [Paracoccaceae bacterium]